MYLILPYVHNPALSWQQKAVAIAYPLGDAAALAMLAQLLTPGPGGPGPSSCSPSGTLGLLASDISISIVQLYGTFHHRDGHRPRPGWCSTLPGARPRCTRA